MTIDYLVDSFGRRVGKKIGGALKQEFVYRGNGLQIAAEIDSTTGKLKSRFRGGAVLLIPACKLVERASVSFAVFVFFPLVFVVVIVPAFFYLNLFVCPRCRHEFFDLGGARNGLRMFALAFSNKCHTCGLRAGQDPSTGTPNQMPGN